LDYQEAVTYLNSFINYEKKSFWPYKQSLKLERIKDFLESLDNPHQNLNYLHIAGTKGKGSVCTFLSYILREAGFKTGLYTSPHLVSFRERIRILNPESQNLKSLADSDFEGMISKNELTELVTELKPNIERFNHKSRYGFLSFFEVYTTLALLYFKKKKVDFAVLETGLGGRLDATNVVQPLVCGITQISYEHTQKLGNTLKEIAGEKAGIIKDQSIVVSSPQEEEVKVVIRQRCKDYNAKLYEIGKDIFFEDKGFDGIYQRFSVQGIYDEYQDLKMRLLGVHQIINASTAIGILEALRSYDISISSEAIRKGLINTFWPGRLEIISKDPFIILDGAQNPASAKALKEAIKRYFNYKRLILILGISKDKNIRGICDELFKISDEIILTKVNNPRATEPEMIKSQIPNLKSQILLTKNSKEAIEIAKSKAEREDLILVTGSLFLVGEARKELVEKKRSKR